MSNGAEQRALQAWWADWESAYRKHGGWFGDPRDNGGITSFSGRTALLMQARAEELASIGYIGTEAGRICAEEYRANAQHAIDREYEHILATRQQFADWCRNMDHRDQLEAERQTYLRSALAALEALAQIVAGRPETRSWVALFWSAKTRSLNAIRRYDLSARTVQDVWPINTHGSDVYHVRLTHALRYRSATWPDTRLNFPHSSSAPPRPL